MEIFHSKDDILYECFTLHISVLGLSNSPFQVALNLLGDTQAGKSSFLASLKNMMKPTRVHLLDRTVGAEVYKYEYIDGDSHVELYIFDFAGHKSYEFFHQIYLTPYAINIIFIPCPFDLIECREQLKRWIYLITAKIPDSMFVVVLSKCDLLLDKEKENFTVSLLQEELKELGCNLSSFGMSDEASAVLVNTKRQPVFYDEIIRLSCEPGKSRGIRELVKSCVSMISDGRLKDRFFKLSDFPPSWQVFLKSLEASRSPGCFCITMDDVRRIACEAGLTEDELAPCLFLFKIMGHILHYLPTKDSFRTQFIFHDTGRLLEVLGQIVHHNQVEFLKIFVDGHVCETTEGEAIIRQFREEGLMPLEFLKSRLESVTRSFQSVCDEGSPTLSEAIIKISVHVGMFIVVESNVFIPSLVKRSKTCDSVQGLLNKQWPEQEEGCEDFQFDLKLRWPFVPTGLLERMVVEVRPYSSGMIN